MSHLRNCRSAVRICSLRLHAIRTGCLPSTPGWLHPLPKALVASLEGSMKLLRYGPRGQELPGLLDPENQIRSLKDHVTDIGPTQLSRAALRRLAAIDI